MASPSAAPSDVVIADRLSDANQVRLTATTGLTVSWELSRAGQLAFDIPLVDLIAYGYRNPTALKGKWLHYEHPTAGPWGGKITNVSLSDGVVSVGAESWAAELKGVGSRVWGGSAYGMVAMLMQQVDMTRNLTGITRGTIDFGGQGDVLVLDEILTPGTDLYDTYIPAVLDRWQTERGNRAGLQATGWNVDPVTRKLSFDATYGSDKSASVWLHAGRHVVGTDIADDLEDVINTVFYSGKVNYRFTETKTHLNKKGKRRKRRVTHTGVRTAYITGVDSTSVGQFGERGQQFQEDFPSETAMQKAANQRVRQLSLDTQNVSIETVDVDDIWRQFREGDIITAALGFDGLIGKMVVRMRALDVASGVMTVAGEATLGSVFG